MKLLRTILACVLLLPVGAWAGSLALDTAGGEASVLPEVASVPPLAPQTGYDCCWVWFNGTGWCFPC